MRERDARERFRRVREDADPRTASGKPSKCCAGVGARTQIDGRPVLREALERRSPVADPAKDGGLQDSLFDGGIG